MEYSYQDPPEGANDGWMGHHVKLYVEPERHQEFLDFLETYCGKKHVDWRVKSRSKNSFWIWGDDPMQVRFRAKKHAALLKLQWVEDEDPVLKTIENLRKFSLKYSNLTWARGTGKSMIS